MGFRLKKKVKSALTNFKRQLVVSKRPKVFCIGLNKTGTTSLKVCLKEWGYTLGGQNRAEMLLPD